MNKQPTYLIRFFIATFMWTWACYIPIAAGGHNPYHMPWIILLIVGGAGPSVVGVAMSRMTYDREQQRDYWRCCYSFNSIGGFWWLVIFMVFPSIMAGAVLLNHAIGGSVPDLAFLRKLIANPVSIPLLIGMNMLAGPCSEELGWRGYALDSAINAYGVVRGTLVLGVLMALWHLPLFFMPATFHGQVGFQLRGFWIFIVLCVGLSFLMTWVYLHTGRSILSAIFMHFTFNFSSQLSAPLSAQLEIIRILLMLVVGILAISSLRRDDPPAPQLPSGR
jgi:membrane protease YdiL (CAAX protease family)